MTAAGRIVKLLHGGLEALIWQLRCLANDEDHIDPALHERPAHILTCGCRNCRFTHLTTGHKVEEVLLTLLLTKMIDSSLHSAGGPQHNHLEPACLERVFREISKPPVIEASLNA